MGNNNSVDPKILNKEIFKTLSSKFMYCPNCFSIPLIKPFLLKGNLYVSLYCKCLNDEKQYMPFENYIQIIEENKDNKDNKTFCQKHKSIKGIIFCISCEIWLCDSCFISHKLVFLNHIYNKNLTKLKEYCHIHKKEKAIGYCNACYVNVCQMCYVKKKN